MKLLLLKYITSRSCTGVTKVHRRCPQRINKVLDPYDQIKIRLNPLILKRLNLKPLRKRRKGNLRRPSTVYYIFGWKISFKYRKAKVLLTRYRLSRESLLIGTLNYLDVSINSCIDKVID